MKHQAVDDRIKAMRPEIQALRAIAVLSVLVYHLWPEHVTGGFVGVDVFFAISGFLITGQLLREADGARRIRLGRFWVRRARRLLPSSLVVLFATALATLAWVPQFRWQQFFSEIMASALYVQNWLLAQNATDYLAASNVPSASQHFWSLSVEEQFYVGVPLLLVLTLVIFRSRWRSAAGILLAVITTASFAYSVYLTETDPSAAYFVTTTRAWEFGLGGLLAWYGRSAPARLKAPAAWLGSAMIGAAILLFTGALPFPGWIAALPVAGTVLVIWAAHTSGVYGRLTRLRPVSILGEVSYAAYLWHWPFIVIAPFALGHALTWYEQLGIIVAAIALAWVTTRYFEEPIRFGLARSVRGGRAVIAGIAALMIVVVGVGAAGYSYVGHNAKDTAFIAAQQKAKLGDCFGAPAALQAHCAAPTVMVPDAAAFANDRPYSENCLAHDGTTAIVTCSVGPEDAAVRVAAIGDSHLWALLPALEGAAKELGWRIDVMAHSGCYWTDAARVVTTGVRADCTGWVAAVDARLAAMAMPYDAIIVTHKESLAVLDPPGVLNSEAAIDGMVSKWKAVEARGTKIIALTDVPRFPATEPDCVAANGLDSPQKCAVTRRSAFSRQDSEATAVQRSSNAVLIDLRGEVYCPGAECSPVIGGVVVLFDNDHLSRTYSTSLAPLLASRLRTAYSGK